MENNNYVSVGNIIEQERLKRQAQIAKGISSDVYDHIEKAYSDDLSQSFEKSENIERFERDIQSLNKAETDLLLHKIQRQMNVDSDSTLLKAMKSIAIQHANDLEKAVYVDNAQNRKLGRVGQQYGGKNDKVSEKDGSTLIGKLTANDAAKFLSEHGEDYIDYQYGHMDEDDDLYDKFEAASKFIKKFEVFDWKQKDEANEYKMKMESKGYHVIDVGNGSDTIAYALIKKDDDTENKPNNNKKKKSK